MAPKRKSLGTSSLVGRTVLVPQSEWPDLKPPRGAKGWKGTVCAVRKEGGYWVRFPDDGQKYSFDDACIRSWVITEPEPEQQQQQEQRQQQQASPAKRGRPAVVEDGAAGAATPGARPSPKKARAGGGAAAASDASTVARLQSMAVALINSSRSVAKLEQAVVALERILD